MNRKVRAYYVRYRRAIAAGFAALSTLVSVNSITPLHSHVVLVATKSLAAGQVLRESDVRQAHIAAAWVDMLTSSSDIAGRALAHPVNQGQPLSASDLLGPSLLSGRPRGQVAVSITVSSADAALVRPGDFIDVMASTGASLSLNNVPSILASDAQVLAVKSFGGGFTSSGKSESLVVAVYSREAQSIAVVGHDAGFVIAVKRGPI